MRRVAPRFRPPTPRARRAPATPFCSPRPTKNYYHSCSRFSRHRLLRHVFVFVVHGPSSRFRHSYVSARRKSRVRVVRVLSRVLSRKDATRRRAPAALRGEPGTTRLSGTETRTRRRRIAPTGPGASAAPAARAARPRSPSGATGRTLPPGSVRPERSRGGLFSSAPLRSALGRRRRAAALSAPRLAAPRRGPRTGLERHAVRRDVREPERPRDIGSVSFVLSRFLAFGAPLDAPQNLIRLDRAGSYPPSSYPARASGLSLE